MSHINNSFRKKWAIFYVAFWQLIRTQTLDFYYTTMFMQNFMSRDCNSLFVLAISGSMYGQEGLEGKSNNLMRNCSFFIEYNISE